MKKWILCLMIMVLSGGVGFGSPEKRKGIEWAPIAEWAIQDRGRIKPMDTFAEETVRLVIGKRSWKDKNERALVPLEILWGWLLRFDLDWEDEAFIRLDYKPLKELLKLPLENQYVTPKALRENAELPKFLREIAKKEQQRERLNELEQKAVQLQNQRSMLDAIMSGEVMAILPNPKGVDEAWFPVSALTQPELLPYDREVLSNFGQAFKKMMDTFIADQPTEFNVAAKEVGDQLRGKLANGTYPAPSVLSREVHYNHLRPFRWAWILYVFAFILFLAHLVSKNELLKRFGGGFLTLGFFLHVYGFLIRCLIAGRPPVTNMYESVIWVSWGCVLFSLGIWFFYKNVTIPTAAMAFSIVSLVIADALPSVLDPGIHPLEPVLRSNYWLTIHVLTITLSYAAFALSLCLGNVVLGNYLFRPGNAEVIQQYTLYMYRSMQIGVVLLAAGTILGGIWADYSWGRFWGWDPKEVWALIALLLYIAVLHGRFTGWLRGFGFAATTVISFLGVLMAWYGVNFVLGAGLHSYGFGTGGLGYVSSYIAAQLAFIGVAYYRYSKG